MFRKRKIHWILFGLVLFVAASIRGGPRDQHAPAAFAHSATTGSEPERGPNSKAGRRAKLDMTKVAHAYSLFVDKKGNIALPVGYKTKWAHLGSFAVAKQMGKPISSMHDVYTQPEVIETYNRTGKFPDGAVLIKEVRNAGTGKMTTGHVAWSTGMNVWFVMIKDTKGRFKSNSHWGDGWGWALFEAKEKAPRKNVSDGYKTSCIGCHLPARKTDWVYMRGYPQLQGGKSR